MARRTGAQDSATRMAIIERAIAIIDAEGCAAVTAGRITRDLGLSRHSVHYYFGTIDELFVAVIRFEGEKTKGVYEALLSSDDPLRLIWQSPGPSDAKAFEYLVLGLRSAKIGAEMQHWIALLRDMFGRAIQLHLERRGVVSNISPVAIGIIVLGISRILAESASLGVEEGNDDVRRFVESCIRNFEMTGEWAPVR